MIWIVIIVGLIILKFCWSLLNDNLELNEQTLEQKFQIIVNILNMSAFDGNGKFSVVDKREFNLYGSNQVINFLYSTGHLTITWKYSFIIKDIVHKRQYTYARNLTTEQQANIATRLVEEMTLLVTTQQMILFGNNE